MPPATEEAGVPIDTSVLPSATPPHHRPLQEICPSRMVFVLKEKDAW